MKPPPPERVEAWLSTLGTWVIIIVVSLTLFVVVRLAADLLDRCFPEPTLPDEEKEEDPWS